MTDWTTLKARLLAAKRIGTGDTVEVNVMDLTDMVAEIGRLLEALSDAEARIDDWVVRLGIVEAQVKSLLAQRDDLTLRLLAENEARAVLVAALREWRKAESSPDCVACCALDAALTESVTPSNSKDKV